MQGIFQTVTPLAANQTVYSPWVDVSGYGDFPYVTISALSDQAGAVQVLESLNPTDSSTVTVTGGAPVAAGVPYSAAFTVRKRFVQVVFTNGAIGQATFQFTAQRYMLAGGQSDSRLLDLILREIRFQNILLLQLREPYGSTVNLPLSFDQNQI